MSELISDKQALEGNRLTVIRYLVLATVLGLLIGCTVAGIREGEQDAKEQKSNPVPHHVGRLEN